MIKETMKILIVEDEEDVALPLRKGLVRVGYSADVAKDGGSAIDLLVVNEYDLMILDLNLPDVDGINTCRFARKKYSQLLILMLTARGELEDIVAGLDSGADDYLIKPFRFEELLARIRALLRRDLRCREPLIKIKDLSLDPVERVVWKSDRRVELTKKEFGVLEYLMRHPGEVISQEELLEHVWNSEKETLSNTVRVHIQSIRNKLGDNSDNPIYISTAIGSGYRFMK
jgi:DNA-binding response OmpR family regulator